MTNDPFSSWNSCEQDASFSEAGSCEHRLTRFERTIRRRNLLEYAAGALVVVLFGAMSVFWATRGEWLFAGSGALVLLGTAFVLRTLHRAGSNVARRPELSCREYFRAQLVRQRDLLRTVPYWYLAPFLPGLLGIYAAVVIRVAQKHGLAAGLQGIWLPLIVTMAFFGFIGWLNLAGARALDRRIAALDSER